MKEFVQGIALGVFVVGLLLLGLAMPRDCNFVPSWSPVDKMVTESGHDLRYAGSNPSGLVILKDSDGTYYTLQYTCK